MIGRSEIISICRITAVTYNEDLQETQKLPTIADEMKSFEPDEWVIRACEKSAEKSAANIKAYNNWVLFFALTLGAVISWGVVAAL